MAEGIISGAEAIARAVRLVGERIVFTVPGTQNVLLLEAFRQAGIRIISPPDECAAGFVANGYARATMRPALLAVIPGPGFLYALPAVAEARHDSVPLVLLALSVQGSRSYEHQEVDQTAIASPLVKNLLTVTTAGELAQSVADAFALSVKGEPGPVMVSVPATLLRGEVRWETPRVQGCETAQTDDTAVSSAVSELLRATRPLIWVGQGVGGAARLFREVVERIGAPVCSTTSGRGVLGDDHPLSFPADLSGGVSGAVSALIDKADLILALGCKFTHNGTAGGRLVLPGAKLIQVDVSPEVLGRVFRPRLSVLGDSGEFLRKVRDSLGSTRSVVRWEPELSLLRREAQLEQHRHLPWEPALVGNAGGSFSQLFEVLSQVFPEETWFVTDTGLHQLIVRRYATIRRPCGLVVPSDFQCMGFGLPAALGVKLAQPSSPVIACIGDGSLLTTPAVLSTAVREQVSLTVLVFNDGGYGLIRAQQLERFGREVGVQFGRVDYEAVAFAFGCRYHLLSGSYDEVFRKCRDGDGVSLVELRLRDTPGAQLARVRSLARESLRSMLPERVVCFLRRVIQR